MKVFLVLFVLLVAAPAGAVDLDTYLEETDALTKQGKYQEALERHIWYHNHALEYDPRDWRRLGTALWSWVNLGKKYQPALDALHKIKMEKTERLETGQGDRAMFDEVRAINSYWGTPHFTAELFRKLDQGQPELARECWDLAWPAVSQIKDRGLVDKYIPDPHQALESIIAGYENEKAAMKKEYPDPDYYDMVMYKKEKKWAWKMRDLIRVYVQLCDKKLALQLQKEALRALDHPEIMGATNQLPYCQ